MIRQKGLTLIELLISVIILAGLGIALSPVFSMLSSSQRQAYVEKHKLNNQMVGYALLQFAANSSALGQLPAPYTGGGYTRTVYNPADASTAGTALTQALVQTGVSPGEINDDGTTAQNVRVYQRVTGLTQQVPLFAQSGPLATLTYQFGAIYLTQCARANTTCNPTPATGIPGTSTALTSANLSTWASAGTDYPAYFVSTLPLQKQMLATTVQRLDRVRDALLGHLRASQMTAAGGDTTNWFPNPTGASGANPATNQGCRDGWYSLASTSVLSDVGLSSAEFGTTAWGGVIQYCRDYDPTGASGANNPPHYAALRINANVSSGIAPDSVVTGNNIVLTF